MKIAIRGVLLVWLTGLAACAATPATGGGDATDTYVEDHYFKQEYMIPMRDGVRLHTAVYSPRDVTQSYPFLIARTPYGCRPYGMEKYRRGLGPDRSFMEEGYIFVYQDVRGRYMSEGEFVDMRPHRIEKRSPAHIDESTDTYDTIKWLLDNVPNHNGRAGMWGVSYPGFYAAAGMIDAHPALVAVSPQAPVSDWWYDDFHHHGAFFLPHAFNFFASFGRARPDPTTQGNPRFVHGTPDGYAFFLELGPLTNANDRHLHGEIAFWNDLVAHPDYDEFWKARTIVPHLRDCAPAVMIVGGWFDAEDLYGPLAVYRSVEEHNPGIFNVLVMGPWRHGGWSRTTGESLGNIHFGSGTSAWYKEHLLRPFFGHYLKDGPAPQIAEATVFETGRNTWRVFDRWPPQDAEPEAIHLHAGGGLAFRAQAAPGGYDEYVSDPARPVPYTTDISTRMRAEYMTDDQRFAARRPDVLVYQSEILDEDVTLAGPVIADLWVSTSGTDSDWIVKLIDVLPSDTSDHDGVREGVHLGGYQMMVRSEVIRGRYRNDPSRPEPFEPDVPTRVRLPLQDVLHTFRAGHRIMVQIQSTWFPLVDRNPQTFVPNIFLAEESDFVKATQRVYCSPQHPSKLEVLRLELD
jgi:putative CocE/NonD family hydrolase